MESIILVTTKGGRQVKFESPNKARVFGAFGELISQDIDVIYIGIDKQKAWKMLERQNSYLVNIETNPKGNQCVIVSPYGLKGGGCVCSRKRSKVTNKASNCFDESIPSIIESILTKINEKNKVEVENYLNLLLEKPLSDFEFPFDSSVKIFTCLSDKSIWESPNWFNIRRKIGKLARKLLIFAYHKEHKLIRSKEDEKRELYETAKLSKLNIKDKEKSLPQNGLLCDINAIKSVIERIRTSVDRCECFGEKLIDIADAIINKNVASALKLLKELGTFIWNHVREKPYFSSLILEFYRDQLRSRKIDAYHDLFKFVQSNKSSNWQLLYINLEVVIEVILDKKADMNMRKMFLEGNSPNNHIGFLHFANFNEYKFFDNWRIREITATGLAEIATKCDIQDFREIAIGKINDRKGNERDERIKIILEAAILDVERCDLKIEELKNSNNENDKEELIEINYSFPKEEINTNQKEAEKEIIAPKLQNYIEENDPLISSIHSEEEKESKNLVSLISSVHSEEETESKNLVPLISSVHSEEENDFKNLVVLRIKPLMNSEEEKNENIVEIQDNSLTIKDLKTNENKKYTFDKIFETENNESVFKETALRLITPIWPMQNACVFAYGVSDTGKSYTMIGTPEEPGIIPLTICEIFNKIDVQVYEIKILYVQIYNEIITDLLSSNENKVEVKDNVDKGINIVGASEILVNSSQCALSAFYEGNSRRKAEENNNSSRSHAVFQIKISKIENNSIIQREILFVDLAGPESFYASQINDNLNEGEINVKSHLALGFIINSLSKGESVVTWKSSKLTHILKGYLDGSCKTIMIWNVSLAFAQYNQSINAIDYALSAKRIKFEAHKNIYNNQKIEKIVSGLIPRIEKWLSYNKDIIVTRDKMIENFKEWRNLQIELAEIKTTSVLNKYKIKLLKGELSKSPKKPDSKENQQLGTFITSSFISTNPSMEEKYKKIRELKDNIAINDYLVQKAENEVEIELKRNVEEWNKILDILWIIKKEEPFKLRKVGSDCRNKIHEAVNNAANEEENRKLNEILDKLEREGIIYLGFDSLFNIN